MNSLNFDKYKKALNSTSLIKFSGRVSKIVGLTVESVGPSVEMGELCYIYPIKSGDAIKAEVVGFRGDNVFLMPLGDMSGIGSGSVVLATGQQLGIRVGEELKGRVLDGLGNPIDGFSMPSLHEHYSADNDPPNPLMRDRILNKLTLGVRALDGLITCGRGQRIGIFAGSGVGKSTLLGMIAKNTEADINVIALIGERGREVREFIENELGEEGLKRSILIVATSDQPALVRVKGAMLATSVAEYFRDKGKNVLLMMDSLTRFSMAQREIGLAVGEPPVTKGYPPSVFAILPRLLERAGNSTNGSITALYTVLVDGDDFNEPISDAVRGILDGHIILSRQLAHLGHYPAIDILGSVSRVMPQIVDEDHMSAARQLREYLATYSKVEDLINIGAYAKGTDPRIDEAVDKYPECISFLRQGMHEHSSYDDTIEALKRI